MGLDEISVAIGRMEAKLEAHTNAHNRIIEQQDSIACTVASIPEIKRQVEKLDDRIKPLEADSNQRKGAIAFISAASGLVGAIAVKAGDFFIK